MVGNPVTVCGGGVFGGDAPATRQGDAGCGERARVQAAGGKHGRLSRYPRNGGPARLTG